MVSLEQFSSVMPNTLFVLLFFYVPHNWDTKGSPFAQWFNAQFELKNNSVSCFACIEVTEDVQNAVSSAGFVVVVGCKPFMVRGYEKC